MKRPRFGQDTRAAVVLQSLCRARLFDEWKRARVAQTVAALELTAATAKVVLAASICQGIGCAGSADAFRSA